MTLKICQFLNCQWRRVIGSFFVIFLALANPCVFSGCHRKSTPEIVYIGHVASFQGPDKTSSEHARQGIQLALEEAEGPDGTINDRRVEVIHVDTKGDAKAMEPATVRLVVINRVLALLGGIEGEQASIMSGIAHNYEVPLVTSGNMGAEKLNDYVFCTGLSSDAQVKALAEYATQHHVPPIRHIAILTDGKDQGPDSFLPGKFSRAFLQTPGTSSPVQWTYKEQRKSRETSERDWEFKNSDHLKDIIELMKREKPEGIFLVGPVSDLPRLRSCGLNETLPLFLADGGASIQPGDTNLSGQPVFFVTAFRLSDDERQKEFGKQYESRFHEVPDAAAALAYDNTRILIDAIKRAASFKGPAIKQAIEELKDFQTLTGMISFDKQDHWPARPAFVVQIQNGRSKVVYTAPAGKAGEAAP